MRTNFWTMFAVVAAAGLTHLSAAAETNEAQAYPTKPIRIVVAFSAGSPSDVLARLIAPKMSEKWGQPVVVDNRPGGAGAIAGGILVNAAPDGHTLMFYSDGHAVNAALYAAKLPYDTLRDIARVSMVSSFSSVLVVAPSLGVKSVKELIALAKARPGQLNFGSAGIGGGVHFSGEMFKQAAGINTVHVPFKGVSEPLAETMTGRIQYMFSPVGPALPFIKDGRLLALAVGSAQRSPLLPDVPTVAEAALPGFAYDLWNGLFAPAKTPRPIVDQINKEVTRIMNLPDIKERLSSLGMVHRANTPEEFDRLVRATVEKLSKVASAAGIRID
jgi:tripartite-type tricarboxylate transporter receptor subunit TctC